MSGEIKPIQDWWSVGNEPPIYRFLWIPLDSKIKWILSFQSTSLPLPEPSIPGPRTCRAALPSRSAGMFDASGRSSFVVPKTRRPRTGRTGGLQELQKPGPAISGQASNHWATAPWRSHGYDLPQTEAHSKETAGRLDMISSLPSTSWSPNTPPRAR